MSEPKYSSVRNALTHGDILTKKGTIKTRGSKFPHMKNLMNAVTRKDSSWRYKRIPYEQAAEILRENPSWWRSEETARVDALRLVKAMNPGQYVPKFETIYSALYSGDILTQTGQFKTRGSKFPHMKELLDIILKKGYKWRSSMTPYSQAYVILQENPSWWK